MYGCVCGSGGRQRLEGECNMCKNALVDIILNSILASL